MFMINWRHIWEPELCKLFGNMSANVLHHARNPLFTTQISNCRLTECPVLFYLAEKYLQRNEFCLLLTLKKLSTLLFTSKLDYCSLLYCGINCRANSQLQLISKCSSYAPDRPTKQGYLISLLCWRPFTSSLKRRDFKILLFVYESLHGLTAQYISQ